ncbi:MAG: group I intron-associated PD-(D/E)XK endonuclease [Candidatus Sulfotelmatobacter sp.]
MKMGVGDDTVQGVQDFQGTRGVGGIAVMARAVRNGFKVSKPWGDSAAYDVGIESGERILRVQVKSTDCRTQYGYLCQFKPNAHSKPYTLKQVDFFAAYVIPEDVWYLIPAAVLLRGKKKKALTLLPEKPRHPERYKCEGYREAWGLMLPCSTTTSKTGSKSRSKAADRSVRSKRVKAAASGI